jgi:hypothetical protein
MWGCCSRVVWATSLRNSSDVPCEVDGSHASLTHLSIDQVLVGNGPLERVVRKGRRAHLHLHLEQLVEAYSERLQHLLPCPARGIGVLPIHDVRPMSSRQSKLDCPVVLTSVASADQLEQKVTFESNPHWGSPTSRELVAPFLRVYDGWLRPVAEIREKVFGEVRKRAGAVRR